MAKYASYILFLLISIMVAILYVNDFGPLARVQRDINDKLLRMTASEDQIPNVVIVSIDGVSQEKFGTWPWNHDLLADLTAAISSGEPKVIVLDCEIRENAEQEKSGNTHILSEQIGWMDNVVLPYDIALTTFRSSKTSNPDHLFDFSLTIDNKLGVMNEESSLLASKVFLPAEAILKAEPYLGFNYVMPDDDRVLRHQPMAVNYEGYYYPSLPLMAAAVYLNVPPDMVKIVEGEHVSIGNDIKLPINKNGDYFINFYKDNPFPKFSASQILESGFNFDRLKGKVIIVSIEDFSNTEYFQSPANDETPRYLISASVISNIINKNIVVPGFRSTMLNLLALLLLGTLCAFVLPQIQLLYRFVTLGIGLFILANISYFMISSSNIIVELVYIGLELVLFMAATPFLESSLVLGDQAEAIKKKKERERLKDLVKKENASGKALAATRVREIRGSSSDPENVATTALSSRDSDSGDNIQAVSDKGKIISDGAHKTVDHQAISLDKDKPSANNSKPRVNPSTMIGSSKRDLNFGPAREDDSEPEIIKPEKLADGGTGSITGVTGRNEFGMDPDDSNMDINASLAPTDLKKLGRYQVTGILGRGAMGQVYKGIDPAINRPLALKTIRLDFVSDPAEMAELKERLTREAHAAGKLSHPNIVTIYDAGSEGDLQYIAMEYLEGRTLESMIKRKVKFNYRIIAQIIVQICAGLDYAHQQGIVHRDIKPANIMISTDYKVKVMDFGIARVDSNSMTKTGIAMGTPNYIAPEQLKGQSVDARADLFSLGVVMYEMLLGKRPFKGESITSLIYSIINSEPEKPTNVNPQIPMMFDHVIGKALKKKPQERYQRATEIVSDLSDFVESFSGKRR